jgi:type II secretory pathway component HofQ
MRRVIVAACVVVGLGSVNWAAPAPTPPMSLSQKLAQRVKFDGIDDPKATLDDALAKLTKLYDVSFDINEKAFKFENVMEVGKTPIADPTPTPAMKNVRLSTILRKILSRIPAPSGATFMVRGDHIEITTMTFQAPEVWGKYTGPHLPLVNTTLTKLPLEDAVKELAEQTDFNVVLDNRAAEQAKTLVSARLLNTPLDTALRLLADMTDLRSVHLDNVLYVTTKENAAALEARLEKEQKPVNPLDDTNSPGEYSPRKGSGPGNLSIRGNGGM